MNDTLQILGKWLYSKSGLKKTYCWLQDALLSLSWWVAKDDHTIQAQPLGNACFNVKGSQRIPDPHTSLLLTQWHSLQDSGEVKQLVLASASSNPIHEKYHGSVFMVVEHSMICNFMCVCVWFLTFCIVLLLFAFYWCRSWEWERLYNLTPFIHGPSTNIPLFHDFNIMTETDNFCESNSTSLPIKQQWGWRNHL